MRVITKKRSVLALWVLVIMLGLSPPAQGKSILISNFQSDPSGPGFQIMPIGPTQGASQNILAPPELHYGVTSGDGTPNCLQMIWQPTELNQDARAGWTLKFLQDPDLTNHILKISVHPPGGLFPNPNPPPNQLFAGITTIDVGIVDVAGKSVGRWSFNTDQAGLLARAQDPLANNLVTVENNWVSWVTINLGNGPAPNSAVVTDRFGNTYAGPDNIIPGNGGLISQAAWLDYYENGNLRGQTQIPGQGPITGLFNYWDSVSLNLDPMVPEPATLLALSLGLATLGAYRRRRMQA